jgi:hypothetical protein
MRDEDLIDTAPVILNERTSVVFESLDLGINERGEIVLSPDKALRCPTLFMTDRGSEITVEAVFHGHTEIPGLGRKPIGLFRFGHQFEITVTRDEPIKIVIVNNGPEPTNIGASLVDTPEPSETKYHLRKDDLKGRTQP